MRSTVLLMQFTQSIIGRRKQKVIKSQHWFSVRPHLSYLYSISPIHAYTRRKTKYTIVSTLSNVVVLPQLSHSVREPLSLHVHLMV